MGSSNGRMEGDATSKRPNDPTSKQQDIQTTKRPNDQTSKLSAKDIRKQRAAERAKVAPKLRELKARVATAEQKIDELQKALDAASAELFNPTPTTDFAEANRKVRTLQFEIDRYTADWEEAATELEALTQTTTDT